MNNEIRKYYDGSDLKELICSKLFWKNCSAKANKISNSEIISIANILRQNSSTDMSLNNFKIGKTLKEIAKEGR